VSRPALRLRSVTKRYGATHALDRLSFELPRGTITGLIGPNGAGKTTCFGVTCGLLQAEAGEVDVLHAGPFDPQRDAGRVGLLPQDCELPPHTRVETYLRYLARLQGASAAQAAHQSARALDDVALTDRCRSRMSELSHGMRRRVAVAQALLGGPELILLDEPVSGLDPHLVAQMRDLLVAQRRRGATLLVSSHILGELEAICDHVVFIEAGRTTAAGPIADITARTRTVRFVLERPPTLEALRARVPDLDAAYEGNTLRVSLPDGAAPSQHNDTLLAALLALDAGVLEVRPGHSLEEAYLDARKTRR
jgi:ABC-type multidrug transport system ATPase subunit